MARVSTAPHTMEKCSAALLLLVAIMATGTSFAADEPPRRVLCTFSSKAVNRSDEYALTLDDIPLEYCTHVVYDSLAIEVRTQIIMPSNPQFDVLQDGWTKFGELKKTNPSLKLLVSFQTPQIADLIETVEQRREFAEIIVWFLTEYNMDGVAVWWFGARNPDGAADLYALFEELKRAFTAAGHPEWEANPMLLVNEDSVEPARLCKLVDFLHLMAIPHRRDEAERLTNVLSPWNNRTAFGGELGDVSVKDSLQTWLDGGCPATQILLGFPFMSRSYTLADPAQNGLAAPTTGSGGECPVTRKDGGCAYFELCQKFNESQWTFKWDEQGVSPYAFQGSEWVGYENAASIEQKGAFARSAGLVGVFGWSLDQDDYRGKCGERFPLTKALWKGFQAKH